MSSVLHLTRDFPPRSAGGISTAVGGLVRTSLRAGMDCAVLSFDGWRPRARAQPNAPTPTPTREPARGDSSEDGLNARVLRVSTPAQLDAARAFARDVGPSVLHVHHDMLWPLAAELRAALGVRAAVTVHVLQAEQSRLRGLGEATLSERAQAQALAEADAVLAPSRAVADALRTMAVPALDQRLLVTPLGIADADADSAAPPDAPARTAHEVLYAGRFADINGMAEVVAAIPRIAARVPAARFVLAGGLPENAKAEARWRRRFATQLPSALRERVSLPGWLPAAALRERYDRAAVLLAPSWFETFGLVVAEAMARGVPIAATSAGALGEHLVHERSALLSAPRDVDGLVENACRLLADRALAARLGRAAAEAARVFSWRARLPALLRVYQRLGA